MPFLRHLRVLVVDDTNTSRMLVSSTLQEIGVLHIDFARDGRQALDKVMADAPHLVISDFNMPNMDGIEFLEAMRAYGPSSKTPFIMLSGKADRDLIQTAARCGANNVIKKPFTRQSLRAGIEAVVGRLQ